MPPTQRPAEVRLAWLEDHVAHALEPRMRELEEQNEKLRGEKQQQGIHIGRLEMENRKLRIENENENEQVAPTPSHPSADREFLRTMKRLFQGYETRYVTLQLDHEERVLQNVDKALAAMKRRWDGTSSKNLPFIPTTTEHYGRALQASGGDLKAANVVDALISQLEAAVDALDNMVQIGHLLVDESVVENDHPSRGDGAGGEQRKHGENNPEPALLREDVSSSVSTGSGKKGAKNNGQSFLTSEGSSSPTSTGSTPYMENVAIAMLESKIQDLRRKVYRLRGKNKFLEKALHDTAEDLLQPR